LFRTEFKEVILSHLKIPATYLCF